MKFTLPVVSLISFQQILLLVLVFSPLFSHSLPCAQQKIEQLGLQKLSEILPGQGGPIDITSGQRVLLDVEELVVGGITIQEDAALYFDWTKNINITTPFITVKGELHIGSEDCPFDMFVHIKLEGDADCGVGAGTRVIVGSMGSTIEFHGYKGSAISWTNLAETAEQGTSEIILRDSVGVENGWSIGDKIVVASTDFNPHQSEVVTISKITGNTVKLESQLTFNHYSDISFGVEMRGEVGLLTRNIQIEGGEGGGHMMMQRGIVATHIEGAEFINMGQDQIGRYPIHFHMVGIVPEGTYVRHNSIHKTNFRCITIHGTAGVTINDNVAYDSMGHCYFLEDGVEVNNTYIHNLALLNKPKNDGERLGSDNDEGVSAFWITNPWNDFINNSVGGCIGTGYWYHFRGGRRGLSCEVDDLSNAHPATTPIKTFFGNKVHGCNRGIQIEAQNFDAGDNPETLSCDGSSPMNFAPRWDNGSSSSTYLDYFCAYKIRDRGIWIRAPDVYLTNAQFADNFESFQFATSGDHPFPATTLIHKATVVGFSANVGTNAPDQQQWQNWDDARESSIPLQSPIAGWRMYDGPQIVTDSVFTNFLDLGGGSNHAALGVRGYNQFQMATSSEIKNTKFYNVTREVYFMDTTADGGKTSNVRDVDGSISGFRDSTILPPIDHYRTSKCRSDPLYGMVCPHSYSNVWILDMDRTDGAPANNHIFLTRNEHEENDHAKYSLELEGFFSASKWRYQAISSIGASYLVHFQNAVSNNLVFQLNNAKKDDYVSFAVCYPDGTTIQSVKKGLANFSPSQDGTEEIPSGSENSSNGESYYWDANRHLLFITIKQSDERTNPGNFCPESGCNFVWINANVAGGMQDCLQLAYSENSIQNTSGSWINQALTPSSSSSSSSS